MKRIQKNSGFTLIEMVLYIGLFGIIMAGLITTAFNLTESARDTSSKVVTEEEINFVLKKMDWALTGADSSTIDIGELPNKLKFTNDSLGADFVFSRNATDNAIQMKRGANTFALTTQNVKVINDLSFTYDNSTKKVTATFVIDGVSSTITKLLKI